MQNKSWTAAILLVFFTNAYANDQQEVQQGAAEYDWQHCIADKTADCTNDCSASEDPDCTDNCDSLAQNKCQSQGLSPPN